MRKTSYVFLLTFAVAGACIAQEAPGPAGQGKPLPIIPGATGFGMETPAGSGRHLDLPQTRVIKVTNLNDSGPGSLREALKAEGPRVVIFEVSGYIDLEGGININNPYLTVAGQTAPWPGIVIRGGYSVQVGTHDVLIQHISVRPGDNIKGGYFPHRGGLGAGREARRVVIDHCSTGWTTQCGLSLSGQNSTALYCLMSEGWHEAGHNEQEHSKGAFINVDRAVMEQPVAMVGCLFAHNLGRNPDIMAGDRSVLANNVIYNWGADAIKMIESTRSSGKTHTTSIEGNVFIPGPDTGGDPEYPYRGQAAWIYLDEPNSKVYLSPDNILQDGKTHANPWEHINARYGFGQHALDEQGKEHDKPHPEAIAKEPPIVIPGYKVKPARQTEAWVLANAGPFPARRNPIDARVIYETRTRTGRGRDDQTDVNGWPEMPENHRELTLPANPNADDNGDGYTNLEEWLHGFADKVEGRKGPIAEADPDLGRRESERCAKRPETLAPEAVRKIRETHAGWTFDAAEAKRRQEEAAKQAGLPVSRKLDLGDGVSIDLVLIPAGEYLMGSKYPPEVTKGRTMTDMGLMGVNLFRREYPPKRVRITKPYYIGQYEVSGKVWAKVMNADNAPVAGGTLNWGEAEEQGDLRCPVQLLTDTRHKGKGQHFSDFLELLNTTAGKASGLTFRLPTEAEWEWACRAGTDTPFWFGETITEKQANCLTEPWSLDPTDAPYHRRGIRPPWRPARPTLPVGTYAPNPWGLYDTVGNVDELVQGSYGVYSDPKEPGGALVDPQAPDLLMGSGIYIVRGGSASSYPVECRSAFAMYQAVYGGRERAGLRVVAERPDN